MRTIVFRVALLAFIFFLCFVVTLTMLLLKEVNIRQMCAEPLQWNTEESKCVIPANLLKPPPSLRDIYVPNRNCECPSTQITNRYINQTGNTLGPCLDIYTLLDHVAWKSEILVQNLLNKRLGGSLTQKLVCLDDNRGIDTPYSKRLISWYDQMHYVNFVTSS